MKSSRERVELQVPALEAFLPLVTEAAEKAALGLGLRTEEAARLRLANEEVFVHLCRTSAPGKTVRVSFERGVYFVEETLRFHSRSFDVGAFNFERPESEPDGPDEETGLFLASKMVDAFSFAEKDGHFCLKLIKEKTYSETEPDTLEVVDLETFTVRRPDPRELKIFVQLSRHFYAAGYLPVSFDTPPRQVDEMEAGECDALIAVDPQGHIGGGLIWSLEGHLIFLNGPFVGGQTQARQMAVALVEACLHMVAKSPATSILCAPASPDLPREYFETCGTMKNWLPLGERPAEASYRQLREDPGGVAWVHPLMIPFVRESHARHDCEREIRPVSDEGETRKSRAVVAVDAKRRRRATVLRPAWWGSDAVGILQRTAAAVQRERSHALVFRMDLGCSWHALFTPALLAAGFEPGVLVPDAGEGDLLLFIWRGQS